MHAPEERSFQAKDNGGVEKDIRCVEEHGIQAIQNAAVSWNGFSGIFDAIGTLEHGFGQIPQWAQNRNGD